MMIPAVAVKNMMRAFGPSPTIPFISMLNVNRTNAAGRK